MGPNLIALRAYGLKTILFIVRNNFDFNIKTQHALVVSTYIYNIEKLC